MQISHRFFSLRDLFFGGIFILNQWYEPRSKLRTFVPQQAAGNITQKIPIVLLSGHV